MKALAWFVLWFGFGSICLCLTVWIAQSSRATQESYEKAYEDAFEQEFKEVESLQPVFLYERDAGKTIAVKRGDLVVIILTCDELTRKCYVWTHAGEVGPACQLVKPHAIHHKSGKHWKAVLRIKPVELGTSVINLQQQQNGGTDVLERTFTVTLNVTG